MTRYRFELAKPEDDAALRRVMADCPMPGEVILTFTREPSFFAGNAVLGNDQQTIVCRDLDGGAIVGLATRSVRELYINGQPQRVGYLSGLRILPAARSGSVLARGFRFLRELHQQDENRPAFYLTTIADQNEAALGSLVGGRAGLPHYHRLGRLRTYVLPVKRLQRTAARAPSPPDVQFHTAEGKASLDALVEFLRHFGRQHDGFPVYHSSDWDEGGGTFAGLARSAIQLASRDGKIVAAAGAWDQHAMRQTIVTGYRSRMRHLRPWLNLFSRLSGGIALPPEGKPLRAAYASFPLSAGDDGRLLPLLLGKLAAEHHPDVQMLLIGSLSEPPWLQSLSALHYDTHVFAVAWNQDRDAVLPKKMRLEYLELGCL